MKKRKVQMRTALIKTYLVTMVVAIVIGGGIFEKINSGINSRQEEIKDINNLHKLKSTIDLLLDRPIYISSQIVVDENINKLLKKIAYYKDNENIQRLTKDEIKDKLSSYVSNAKGIDSVYILDQNSNLISSYTLSSMVHDDIVLGIDSAPISQNKGKEYIDIAYGMENKNSETSIYIARAILEKETLQNLGYLVLVLSPDFIRDNMISELEYMEFNAVLISQNGYSFEFNRAMREEQNYRYGIDDDEYNTKDYVVLDYKNISLVGRGNREYEYEVWINIMIGVLIVNIIFLIIMIVILARKVVYPLEDMASKAKLITRESDLSVRLNIENSYEEIALIESSINEMLDNVQTLFDKVKEKERTERILELSVINHQVNPHFLYNTLNSVGMLIAMEEKDDAQELIASLSRYYRACLNLSDFNTVGQELVILKEYVNIIRIKNPSLITISYEIDTSLTNVKMPRMILQTLVENCIKHGIRTTDEPLCINITISRDKNREMMVVAVRDNGRGIDIEVKNSILKEETLKSGSGFGLKSTIRRVALMNMESSVKDVLEINSECNKYTEIIVYIPIFK